MRRASLILLTCVAASVAAPVPKKAPTDYFPTALGTKWEYAPEGETEATMTEEVTKVTEKDGVKAVEITIMIKGDDKQSSTVATYRIDADGVSMTVAEGKELTPPRLDLRAKPKAEDKWDSPHEWMGAKYTLAVEVGKEEKVEVPVGKFAALPHTQTFTLGNTTFPARKRWYAPDIGLVKSEDDGAVMVLVKYTSGKDK